MKQYGYCRISRRKQSIERQIRNIRQAYPNAIIIQEAGTGTSLDRKEWNKLMKLVKEGDAIVFDSVSRMSRNAEKALPHTKNFTLKVLRLFFSKSRISIQKPIKTL